jgi:hypothetical protein
MTPEALEAPRAAEPMLIDRLQPDYDATTIQHAVAAAPPERAYAAALDLDLGALAQRDPVFRALFLLRVLPERVITLLRGEPAAEPQVPRDWRLRSLPDRGEWVRLGEVPGREVAFGAIGRFWGAKITWETIDAAGFAGFDRPGFGKIVCAISARPYGEGRTLLSYEARTSVTDPGSRTAFLRYWRALGPFIGVLLHRTLSATAEEAEAPSAPPR